MQNLIFTENKPVAICSDHAGFDTKNTVKKHLESFGFEVVDFGTFSTESCDYPDFAHPCADAVENGKAQFAVALCGTGNGISMTLNKHQGIRAALCWQPELAKLSREHNDANILVMPARFISQEEALRIVDIFITTPFEGGRHIRRIEKIPIVNPA